MKELDKLDRDVQKQAIEVLQRKKKETEYAFKGSIKPYKGHLVFEINKVTLEIKVAELIKEDVINWFDAIKDIDNGVKCKISTKENCVYISAASKFSALKRFNENRGSAIMPKSKGFELI